jgi:hypothetical protein
MQQAMINFKYKLVIEHDGKDVHTEELGSTQVRAVAGSYGWRETPSTELMELLSAHPSADIREEVADFGCINEEVCKRLAKDASQNVIQKLFQNDYFKRWVSTEQVVEYINSFDPKTIMCIASAVDDLPEPQKVCDSLLSHKDPQVRRELAENGNAPKGVIMKLTHDADLSVRSAALSALK